MILFKLSSQPISAVFQIKCLSKYSTFSKDGMPYSEYYPDVQLKYYGKLDDIEFPPNRRRLHPHTRTPLLNVSNKPHKDARHLIDYRGPERIRNELTYKQYGVQAMEGGELLFGHLEMLRLTVNKGLDEKRMFACWGVESPWKSKTKRAAGKRMGGGKANISHYVTPIKSGRIIIELGGYLDWREAYRILSRVADKLPFRSRFVSQRLIDAEGEIEAYIKHNNVNPFFDIGKVLSRNYAGCQSYISPYYYDWGSVDHK